MSGIYSIDFTKQANQNPLSDSGNWSTAVWGTPNALQILNGSCQGQLVNSNPDEYLGAAALVGPTLPNDQQSSFTLGTLTNPERIRIHLRENPASSSFTVGRVFFQLQYDGTWQLLGTDNSISKTLASGTTTFNQGDVFRLVAQGTTVSAFQNGVLLAQATQSVPSAFNTPVLEVFASSLLNGALAKILAYSAGPAAYSEPDCRNYSQFPNSSRNVQGTLIYDKQSSSDSLIPGTDSRAAGAPTDSRTQAIIPQNSRTAGTIGPGE